MVVNGEATQIVYKFDGVSDTDENYAPQCKKEKRTKLCYFLLFFIVIVALATITAGVVLLKRAKENKTLIESNTLNVTANDEKLVFPKIIRNLNEYCAPSREARRIRLDAFLTKCQALYFKIYPHEELTQYSDGPQHVINKIAKKFRPFIPTPLNLKKITDQIKELTNELDSIEVDEEILKPKENQVLAEMKSFLSKQMSEDYESGFYGGGWMFGPNNFCLNRVCKLQEEITLLTYYFRPSTEHDVEWLAKTFLRYNDTLNQHIENLKMGIKTGMVKSQSSCHISANTFRDNYFDIIDRKQQHSSVSIPLRSKHFYSYLSPKVLRKWKIDYDQSIPQSLYSALVHGFEIPLQRYYNYLSTEYAKKCPPDSEVSGLARLPVSYEYEDGIPDLNKPTTQVLPVTGEQLNGKELYGQILKRYVTLNVSAEDVYEEGKSQLKMFYSKIVELAKEITQIEDENEAMTKLRQRLNEKDQWHGVSTKFPDIESNQTAHVRCKDEESAKKYCPIRWKSMQKWKNYFDRVLAMIHPQLNDVFHFTGDKVSVPNCPINIEPHYRPSLTTMLYGASDAKCSFPTTFSLPFFADRYGPKFQEWSIAGHEARPGHNFQGQGSVELFASPCSNGVQSFFHNKAYSSGFVEGWATYTENPVLSDDVQLYYNNLFQKLGMYNWQALHAARLIIDTGLHNRPDKTRKWALKKLEKYTLHNTDFINKEVARSMSVPGHATSYMMGRLEIMKARKNAELASGKHLDIKEFHYQILSLGPVPLEYLSKYTNRYLNCFKNPKRTFCEYVTTPVRSIPKGTYCSASKTLYNDGFGKKSSYL